MKASKNVKSNRLFRSIEPIKGLSIKKRCTLPDTGVSQLVKILIQYVFGRSESMLLPHMEIDVEGCEIVIVGSSIVIDVGVTDSTAGRGHSGAICDKGRMELPPS